MQELEEYIYSSAKFYVTGRIDIVCLQITGSFADTTADVLIGAITNNKGVKFVEILFPIFFVLST